MPIAKSYCVLNTDPGWIESLRRHPPHWQTNFWRKDRRQFHLPPGTPVFFRLKAEHELIGQAIFIEKTTMSVAQAWKRFGAGNGSASDVDFAAKIAREELDQQNLNCLILEDLNLWNVGLPISETHFSKFIQAHKFFKKDELKLRRRGLISRSNVGHFTTIDTDVLADAVQITKDADLFEIFREAVADESVRDAIIKIRIGRGGFESKCSIGSKENARLLAVLPEQFSERPILNPGLKSARRARVIV